MIIEVMVIGDEKIEKIDFFQKVVGVILDFMGTFWGHGNGFFRRRKKTKKHQVFKMSFRPFQGTKSSYIRSGNWSKPQSDDL